MGVRQTRERVRLRYTAWAAFIVCVLAVGAQAQVSIGNLQSPDTPTVFWSQVNTYVGLTPNMSFMFLASGTPGKDADHPSVVFGPNLDIAVLPFLTPHLKVNNPERSKYLTFRIGYRYVRNLYGANAMENNGVLELTPRIPLPRKFQIADRNRIDLRGLEKQFSWRYRNRLAIARSFQIRDFALTPYGEAEVFYNCETGQWTQYNYRFGVITRFSPKIEVETWFKRTTTIVQPIASVDVVGVKLILFFRTFGSN